MAAPAPPLPPSVNTSITADAEALAQARQRFVAHWGDMASAWGISRTMAQVYALLYGSGCALDTDRIMTELDISRGNANMTLHKLMEWGIVRKDERGDRDSRKDYFVAETDVWALTLKVIRERNQKEIQPVSAALTELAAGLPESQAPEVAAFKTRIEEMADFLTLFNTVVERMLPLLQAKDLRQIEQLLTLLDSVRGKS